MKTLAMLLPINGMLKQARDQMLDVMSRHDVPQGPDVPEDLRDVRTDFLGGLQNGGRITGRLDTRDALGLGWRSPVESLMMLMLPVLVCLGAIIGTLFSGALAALLILVPVLIILTLLFNTMKLGRFLMATAMCLIVPLLGVSVMPALIGVDASAAEVSEIAVAGYPLIAMFGALLLALFLVYAFSKNGDMKEAVSQTSKVVAVFFVATIITGMLPEALRSLHYVLIGCVYPFFVYNELARERANHYAVQAHICNIETKGGGLSVNTAAREQQVIDAIADTSPLIEFGTARGVLQTKRDTYAPDKGLPMRMSMRDMSNSILITGGAGSGKTVLIRNILCQALQHEVGLLILCGKAELPLDFAGLKDYTIIRPGAGIKLGLIEGLNAEQAIQTIFINANPNVSAQGGEGGGERFFNNAGYEMGVKIAVLLEALIDAERKELKTLHEGKAFYTPEWLEAQRQFAWTLGDISRLLDQAIAVADRSLQQRVQEAQTSLGAAHQSATDVLSQQGNWFGQYVHKIKLFLDESERSALLDESLDYFTRAILNLDEKTLSNVQFTVRGWFQPLQLHRDLIEWSETERGMDVSAPLRGGRLGVALPKNLYGQAARMIQALIKVRIQNEVLKRGNNKKWREDHIGTDLEPQTPVFIVMDEAQDLVDPNDGEYIRKCRAFEGITIFGSQSIENFYEAMGDKSADAFISNCNNRFTLRCSFKTATWFCQELGTALLLKWIGGIAGLSYEKTMIDVATSPILDPSHPYRSYYKKLLRKGALGIRLNATGPRGPSQPGAPRDTLTGHQESGVEDNHKSLEIIATTEVKMEEAPLLSPGELMRYTAERGVAVAFFNRAGVPRRDVMKVPMLDPAVELGDQWTA